jgi:hypothetical protein
MKESRLWRKLLKIFLLYDEKGLHFVCLDIREHDQIRRMMELRFLWIWLWHGLQTFRMECGDRFIPSLALHRPTDCFSFVSLSRLL